MARPTKYRRVAFIPENNHFVPAGRPRCQVEEIELKVEELEAMRLKDIENLNQEEAAKKMAVSRQTFQNIIDSARHKVALALTQGRGIRINGGNFTTYHCRYQCSSCEETYEINYAQDKHICPSCGSKEVLCTRKEKGCKGWCNQK